jgi:hypothetical protein
MTVAAVSAALIGTTVITVAAAVLVAVPLTLTLIGATMLRRVVALTAMAAVTVVERRCHVAVWL